MGTVLIIIGVIGALICYSACALPKSEYEQRMEDEEQMKYIREYRKTWKDIKENITKYIKLIL